jgi:hypothetical protein
MVRRIAALWIWTTAFGLCAGDAPLDRATLKGIKAVGVVIDALPADLPKEGVTPEALESRLATRLREAHIDIEAAAKEFVGVRVTAVRASRGPYAVAITVGLYQPVTLVRDPSMRAAPETWEVETILMADPKLLYRAAMESVDELAGRFATAYHSVNPE